MYEKRHHGIAPKRKFLKRLSFHIEVALLIVVCSLGIGMVGYRHTEGMSWVDAFVNAAMILSGMGPVSPLETDGGKLFAGLYALFSGIIFLFAMGIIAAPLIHRFLHKFLMNDRNINGKM